MDLTSYIKSCYSILYICSPEEARVELFVIKAAEELKRKLRVWSYTDGFKVLGGDKNITSNDIDPVNALIKIRDEVPEKGGEIIVMRDLHMFLTNPKPIRLLRDIANIFKKNRKTLIIIGPIKKIPPELERDITVLELELPSKKEIKVIFDSLYSPPDPIALATVRNAVGEISDDEQEKIIQSALGMTFSEIENTFSKSFIEYNANKLVPISKLVVREKAIALKKSGILEYFEPKQTANDIGGLDNLKTWLKLRSKAFTKKAVEAGIPPSKGIIIAGIPGGGKSLAAKAASNILGLPLIRFDISRVYGGLVGDSERNVRVALQTIDTINNCIVWMDELEKCFSGANSGFSGDGGTGARVFGTFITWLQERTGSSFVIATLNRIEGLPPELLRKGRFDEIFFVGLPNAKEREQIFNVHLRLHNQSIDENELRECVKFSTGFSGAEIAETVVSGMYNAFDQDRKLCAADIIAAIKTTNPLSHSKEEELKAMVEWAKINAVNASKSDPDEEKTGSEFGSAGRQLQF